MGFRHFRLRTASKIRPAGKIARTAAGKPSVKPPHRRKPLLYPSPKQPPSPVAGVSPPLPKKEPVISIIIDDFGNDPVLDKAFINLPYPVTVSILPRLPASKMLALKAAAQGKPYLLHLPVEAIHENQFLGPGAVFTGMKPDEMKQIIDADLETVPGADGINNHMGSKGTRDKAVTEAIATAAKAHHLFIVDSLTVQDSILYRTAREQGVPETERDVFLDDAINEPAITKQFEELLALARKNGKALAIGHPYQETLHVLQTELPKLSQEKIKLIPITEYVEP